MAEKSERAQREEKILQFWKENKIFEKTLEKKAPKGEFVFYDGPPFATGLPHAGSLLSSVIKDVIPRYKTMRGYHVRRRWGWDCHGLPIENMIEKELGLKDKKEIENKIGIKAFNEACRSSVLRYAHEWKRYVERVGRWVEYDNAYKTMDNTYIESVWRALKEINDKNLLYEGKKVLLYCPHCETPIAKAEVAMDNSYKDVTEEAVYVKFKLKAYPNAYFLAWTTTPWTLPGNVALAVGKDIDYVEIKMGDEILALAKDRLSIISEPYEIIAEHKGSEMVGMEYEPLFNIFGIKQSGEKAFYVAEADFVNTEEGTGIVHTAVLYGEDDYGLGLKLNLPMVQMLDSAGHFNDNSPEFIRGQYFKKAERIIKEDLQTRNLLFKKENHTHSYPHCHRCGTALLYNAISSWFINIQKIKGRMIELNEKMNWIPEHLKHGRFLNIVKNAPDWTISRNRYWAAPLPIWKDDAGKVFIIGSLDELKELTKKSGNKYFAMRHGEGEHNISGIAASRIDSPVHLTENGKLNTEAAAEKLSDKKIDFIYASPLLRTKETAEIVAKKLGISSDEVVFDKRLKEIDVGGREGKKFSFIDFFQNLKSFDEKIDNGESPKDVRRRVAKFFYEIEEKHKGKNVLIVTHGIFFEIIESILNGMDDKQSLIHLKQILARVSTGKVKAYEFVPLPHNENYELDLHRPYIDEIKLEKDGKKIKRIPEVIDGWVESASMPFAEYHYPFENKKEFEARFPGDFVAEYIAQTRTWFYYSHAVAVALFNNISFKNVVTTGNVLAADGSKMSKSKGNYTDPLILLDTIGADAFRYYLMSSVVMQAEDMFFKDEEIKEIHNRLINILANSFNFYELYADSTPAKDNSDNVLDRWIVARLNQLAGDVTSGMETYDMVQATRPMRDFVTDLSAWYIRRSRDRFKNNDKEALATARHVFLELSKFIAPVVPFIAEEIYQKVKNEKDPESVHLAAWPPASIFSRLPLLRGREEGVIEKMKETRKIVTLALEQRHKANIKVRQPLLDLRLKIQDLGKEYLEIIKDEINVKQIIIDPGLQNEVELNTSLTLELIEEGKVRDVIRAIQDWRKEQGLKPRQSAQYPVPESDKAFIAKHKEEISRITNVEFINLKS